MKTTKALSSMFLALVLAASLAGCGSSSSSSSKKDDAKKQETQQVESADEGADEEAEAEEEEEPEAPETDVAVTIDGAKLGTDYSGNEVVIVTYTFTNVSSDDAESFLFSCVEEVYQNGVELEKAYIVDGLEGSSDTKVKAGASYTLQQAYLIQDHSDVEVEIKEAFSWDDVTLASATFSF